MANRQSSYQRTEISSQCHDIDWNYPGVFEELRTVHITIYVELDPKYYFDNIVTSVGCNGDTLLCCSMAMHTISIGYKVYFNRS
jgi:hypothetical protein